MAHHPKRGKSKASKPSLAKRSKTPLSAKPKIALSGRRPNQGARGPRKGKSPAAAEKLQFALGEMSNGKSLTASARRAGISHDRLRYVLIKKNLGRKVKGRWVLGKSGGRLMLFFKDNEAYYIAISYRSAARYGAYLAARKTFLEDDRHDLSRLKPYEGKFIVDLAGKRHFFETRPNVLYRQDQAGAEPHEQFYQFIV